MRPNRESQDRKMTDRRVDTAQGFTCRIFSILEIRLSQILIRSRFSLVFSSTIFFSDGMCTYPVFMSRVRLGPSCWQVGFLFHVGPVLGFTFHLCHPQGAASASLRSASLHSGGSLQSILFCLKRLEASRERFSQESQVVFFLSEPSGSQMWQVLSVSEPLLHPLGHRPLSNAS